MNTYKENKTYALVMAAVMTAAILVMTFFPKVPVPATRGYVHLGDCMIFFAVLVLGWKRGAAAAGLGSALADLLGGYAYYAPATLVIKALMAAVVGLFIQKALSKERTRARLMLLETVGMALGGLVMVVGYYLVECVMYGNFVLPLAAVPMNIVQFVVGIIIAGALANALYRTPARRVFAYVIPRGN